MQNNVSNKKNNLESCKNTLYNPKILKSPNTEKINDLFLKFKKTPTVGQLPHLPLCSLSSEEIAQFSVLDDPQFCEILSSTENIDSKSLMTIAANFLGGGLITNKALEGMNPYLAFKIWASLSKNIKNSYAKETEDPQLKKLFETISQCSEQLLEITEYFDGIEKTYHQYDNIVNLVSSKKEEFVEKKQILLGLITGMTIKNVEKYAQKIRSLKPGETQLLYGGWHDQEGGHAQIYEIVRQKDQKFSFILYTSTGYPEIQIRLSENKVKIEPLIVYENIPEDVLLCGDSHTQSIFLQDLFELKLSFLALYDLKLNTASVRQIFEYLSPYRAHYQPEETVFIKGQRAGTCVFSVMKAFVRLKCKDINLYKQFIFHSKFKMLISLFHGSEKDFGEIEATSSRRRWQCLLNNFLRSLSKMSDDGYYGSPLLAPEFIKVAQATCNEMHTRLDKAEQTALELKKNHLVLMDLADPQVGQEIQEKQKEIQKARIEKLCINIDEKIKDKTLKSIPLRPQPQPFTTPQEWMKQCRLLLDSFKNGYRREKEWKYHILLDFIETLPFMKFNEKDCWSELSTEEAKEYIELLAKVTIRFSHGGEHNGNISTQTAALTLYNLVHALSLQIEQEQIFGRDGAQETKEEASISSYKVINHAYYVLNAKGNLFLDKKEFERLQSITTYFEEFNNTCKKEHNESLVYTQPEITITTTPGQFFFWEALLKLDPVLEKEVSEVASKFRSEIPLQVKRLLLLEMSTESRDFDGVKGGAHPVLKKLGYNYLHLYRKIAHLSNSLYGAWTNRDPGPSSCTYSWYSHSQRMSIYSRIHKEKIDILKNFNDSKSIKERIEYDGYLTRRDDDIHLLSFISNTPLYEYEPQHHSNEAKILADLPLGTWDQERRKNSITKEERSLSRLLAEPSLTPDGILEYYRSNFKGAATKTFSHLFFRPIISKKGVKLGIEEMLLTEKAFRENTLRFLKDALISFHNTQEEKWLESSYFFFKIAFWCAKFLKDGGNGSAAKEFCQLEALNDLLTHENLDPKQRLELHRIRLLFFSLNSITAENLPEIFVSWIHDCSQYDFRPDYLLKSVRDRFMLKVLDALPTLKVDESDLGKKILLSKGCVGLEDEIKCIERDNNLLKLTDDWTIDLFQGEIYSKQKEMSFDFIEYYQKDWEKSEIYQALFKDRKFEYQLVGHQHVRFKDPMTQGEFYIYKREDREFIYSQKIDGDLFTYDDLYFPLSLTHPLWFDKINKTGFLIDKKTNKKTYRLDEKGVISEISSGKIVEMLPQGSPTLKKLYCFDAQDKILTVFDPLDQDLLAEIQFPFRLSPSQTPLRFMRQENQFVLKENPYYFLPQKQPTHFFESTEEYLYLESKRPQRFPDQLLVSSSIDNTYFIYEVVEGEASPTTVESYLYLAFLYLKECRYRKAMHLLRTLKPTTRLSEKSLKILNTISSNNPTEDHPDGKMISLYALLIQFQEVEKKSISKPQKYPEISSQELLIGFFTSRRNISSYCSFSNEEELKLLTIIDEILTEKKYKKYERCQVFIENRLSRLRENLKTEDLTDTCSMKPFSISSPSERQIKDSLPATLSHEEGHDTEVKALNQLIWKTKNDSLLLKVLTVAKTGTVQAKKCMLYRLRTWFIRYQDPLIVMMIDYLTNPSKIPNLEYAKMYENKELEGQRNKSFLMQLRKNCREIFLPERSGIASSYTKSSATIKLGYFPHIEEVSLSVEDVRLEKKALGEVCFPVEQTKSRWETLSVWQDRFIKPVPLQLDKISVNESILDQELEAGRERLENSPRYTLKTDRPDLLISEAQEILIKVDEDLLSCELQILTLANKQDILDEKKRLQKMIKIGGLISNPITIDDCLSSLLSFDQNALKTLNPLLEENDIKELTAFLLKRAHLKSWKNQLHDILQAAEKKDWQKMGEKLAGRYHFEKFNTQTQIAFSIYCGETGLIPYLEQTRLIEKMLEVSEKDPKQFKDLVIKLIPGSGKTSVLAVLALFLMSRKDDRLAMMFVLPSLFDVVGQNLSSSLFKAFRQNLLDLDVPRNELSLYKLKQIYAFLHRALENKEPLVIKASMVQCIELEFLDQGLTIEKLQSKEEFVPKEILERYKLLDKIDSFFKSHGAPLLDEVETILNPFLDVIFPVGDKQSIKKEENALLYEIFRILLAEEKKLEKFVGLTENRQALLTPEIYHKSVVPVIVETLLEKYQPFQSISTKSSCARYLKGEIPTFIRILAEGKFEISESLLNDTEEFKLWKESYKTIKEVQDDVAFLKKLEVDYRSNSKYQKKLVERLAIVRGILLKILPITLRKSGNRNFGPSIESTKKGLKKIVPYLGVNTPSNTEFSTPLIEAGCALEWVAAFPLSKEEVSLFLDRLARSTLCFDEPILGTIEAKKCKEIFGINLTDRMNPQALENALRYLEEKKLPQEKINDKLLVMYELIYEMVTFHMYHLASCGTDFLRMFDWVQGMSGTPYDYEGYLEKMAKSFEEDKGADGAILYKLLERKAEVLEIEFNTVKEFMDLAYNKNIHAIIEAGGLFANFSTNKDVAEELVKYLAIENPEIKAVLFFGKGENDKTSDTLYMWKNGEKDPVPLPGTTPKDIPLDPSEYLVYYDERHVIGADIVLADKEILMTYDHTVSRQLKCQAVMRARKFLTVQHIKIVKRQEEKSYTIETIIQEAEKTQNKKKTNNIVRFYKQQIDSLFRMFAVKRVKELGSGAIKFYSTFYLSEICDDSYLNYGLLDHEVKTKNLLLDQLQLKIDTLLDVEKKIEVVEKLKKIKNNEETVKRFNEEVETLKNHILNTTILPETIISSSSVKDGNQEVNKETEKEKEVEQELEMELEEESQIYNKIDYNSILVEDKLTEEKFLKLVEDITLDLTSMEEVLLTTSSLQEQLKKFPYGIKKEVRDYHLIFTQPLFGTKAFFYATDCLLPVFHRMQKVSKQLLLIQTEKGLKGVFVSIYEAARMKKILKGQYEKDLSKNIWLIEPDASLLIDNPHGKLPQTNAFDTLLMEWNIFNGDLNFLTQNYYKKTFSWIYEDHEELKMEFLRLRAPKDQRFLLKKYTLHDDIDDESTSIFSLRREQENNKLGKYLPTTVEEAQECPCDKINELNVQWVRHLGSKDPLKRKKQFKKLQIWQLPHLGDDQIPELPDRFVRYLKKPEHISLLSKEQIEHMRLSQRDLISFVKADFYPSFKESWQIRNIPPHQVNLIDPKFTDDITEDQALFLQPDRFGEIKNNLNLFAKVHGNHLEKIPSLYHDRICKDQISQITDPEVIKKLHLLPKEKCQEELLKKWIPWIPNNMIQHVDLSRSHLLTEVQAKDCSLEQFRCLDKNVITKLKIQVIQDRLKRNLWDEESQKLLCKKQFLAFVKEDLVKWITEPQFKEVINELENDLIEGIIDAKRLDITFAFGDLTRGKIQTFGSSKLVSHLPEQQLNDHLKVEQVSLLTEKEVPKLTNPLLINACTKEQLAFFLIDSLEKLGQEKIQRLLKGTLENLFELDLWNERLQALLKKEQLFDLSKGSLVKWITETQFKEFINDLENDKIEGIIDAKRLDITSAFGDLTGGKIQTFGSSKLVSHLPEQQLNEHLKVEQVSLLTEKEVPKLTNPLLINACTKEQLAFFLIDSLEKLGQEKIQGLSKRTLENLFELDLWNEKLQALLKKEQLFDLSKENLVKWITKTQFKEVINELENDLIEGIIDAKRLDITSAFGDLTRVKIQTFGSYKLVSCLSDKQIDDHLKVEQVSLLTENEVAKLTNPLLINACTKEQLAFFSIVSLEKLGQEKIQGLSKRTLENLFGLDLWSEKLQAQLKKEQLFDLSKENLVKRITEPQFKEFINDLENDEIEGIAESKRFNAPSSFDSLTKEKIQAFASPKLFGYLSEKQINDHLKVEQVSILSDSEIAKLINPLLIDRLSDEKLKHLANQQAVQKLSFWRIVHLEEQQMSMRTRVQKVAYAVGVIALGIFSTAIFLLSIVIPVTPVVMFLCNRQLSERYWKVLTANHRRLGHWLINISAVRRV